MRRVSMATRDALIGALSKRYSEVRRIERSRMLDEFVAVTGYHGSTQCLFCETGAWAYAVGHISGGHFNPPVTIGLWSAGRCANHHVLPYIIAQVIGAIVAAGTLWIIASGKAGWVAGNFASNGFGELSPGKYSLAACFATETLLTLFFIFIIIGTTSKGAAVVFAGIPIGLALTLIHLISIPVTNTSVNPARSTGPALFAGGEYIRQLWLFWVAPLIGAAIGGVIARWMYEPAEAE
jgi:aquaporin Z